MFCNFFDYDIIKSMKINKNNLGFTLIELTVAVLILAVLSSIIINMVSQSQAKSQADLTKVKTFDLTAKNKLIESLIGEWNFDEGSGSTASNASDYGSLLNGTIANGSYAGLANCISGNCLTFNGTSTIVTCTNNTALDVTSAFTLSMWINRTATSSGILSLIRRDSSDTYAFYSAAGATSICVRFKDSSSSHHLGTAVTVPTGSWNHIVGTFDGRYINFYLNGVLSATTDTGATYTVGAGASDLIIGRNDAVTGRYFNGKMDEVRIYSSALTIVQIQEQYYAGLNKLLANGGITKQEYNQRVAALQTEIAKNDIR